MKYYDIINKCNVDVIEVTSNSVRIFHKKQTKHGIDCYQWYDINGREFITRFKKI